MKKLLALSVFAFVLPFSALAHCEAHAAENALKISEPWVRATVPQQNASGAFMTITARGDARLVAAASPAARVVEVHEMSIGADNVMRMRAIEGLDLPAGRPVELKPGGYHVMLIDLVEQLKEGAQVPLTLTIETADGERKTIPVEATVRALTQQHGGASSGHHGHKHH
jgi:copper(I)-binding protein